MKYLSYLDRPLGVDSVAPMRKEWVAQAIGVVGGLASSLIGGGASAAAARKGEQLLRNQQSRENAWYNRRYNEDYVDTAAGQNLVRRAKEYAKENWRKAAGAKAVAGGTDAATQMAKDAGNKMVGDTIANIAATDQARKAQVDNMHRQAEMGFTQQEIGIQNQKAANITNAAQNASNAMMAVGSAVDQASANNTSLSGGSNGGTTTGAIQADAKSTMPQSYTKADAGKVNLQSNVGGIGGEHDLDWLRSHMT